MQWFKNLSTLWKIVVVVAVLAIGVFILDMTTGYVRDAKNYLFDRNQAKIEAQNTELLAANEKLRAENVELVKGAIEAKAKEAVFEERKKNLDAKTKAELEKVDKALEEQANVEAETAEPIDDYTRCNRSKEKLLAVGIQSAQKIDCEVFKHE